MSFAWTGQILRVDLSNRKSWVEPTEPYTRSFIGGRGINAKIMYDELEPEVLPFDPANMLCLGVGVLTGTLAPGSPRTKITSISPKATCERFPFPITSSALSIPPIQLSIYLKKM